MPKYIDTEELLDDQTPAIRQLLHYLRQLMAVAHPQMRERFLYNTLFFVCYDYVCYIGKIHPKKGVEIGFPKGALLNDTNGVLEANNRKFVRGITFKDLADFQAREEAFLEILQEAIMLNEANPAETFFKIVANKRWSS